MILVFLDETMTLEDTIARYEATKRAAKEKATLERIVKEEDERLKCVFDLHPQPFLLVCC